jgi:hypothetical protein
MDYGRAITDILAMRNMVALRLISEYSKDVGLHIQTNASESAQTHYIAGLTQKYKFPLFLMKKKS